MLLKGIAFFGFVSDLLYSMYTVQCTQYTESLKNENEVYSSDSCYRSPKVNTNIHTGTVYIVHFVLYSVH